MFWQNGWQTQGWWYIDGSNGRLYTQAHGIHSLTSCETQVTCNAWWWWWWAAYIQVHSWQLLMLDENRETSFFSKEEIGTEHTYLSTDGVSADQRCPSCISVCDSRQLATQIWCDWAVFATYNSTATPSMGNWSWFRRLVLGLTQLPPLAITYCLSPSSTLMIRWADLVKKV